ncbi:MAG: hypothetical protein WCL32_25385 [Planctomycetota bacterium]
MRWIVLLVLTASTGSAVGAEPPMPAPVQIDSAEGAKAAFVRAGNDTPYIEPYIVAGEKWIQIRLHEVPNFGGPRSRWMTMFAIAPSTEQIRCVTVPPAKIKGDDQIAYRFYVGNAYAQHAVLLTLREIRCGVDEDPDNEGTELRETVWGWNLETGTLTWLLTTAEKEGFWISGTLARIADSLDYDTIWTDDPAKKWRNQLRFEPRLGNPRKSIEDTDTGILHVAAPERTVIAASGATIEDGRSLSRYSFDEPAQVLWRHTSADYSRQAGRRGHVKRIVYQLDTIAGDVFPILFQRRDDAGFAHEIWLINVADGTFNRRILADVVLPSIMSFVSTSHDGRYLYAIEYKGDRAVAEIFFDVKNDRLLHRNELPDQMPFQDYFTGFLDGRGVRKRLSEQIELFNLATPERREIVFDLRKLAGVAR